jgi:hypothetical protein
MKTTREDMNQQLSQIMSMIPRKLLLIQIKLEVPTSKSLDK